MTSTIPLQIKWGKQTIEMPYDPATGYQGLVRELAERTAVPANRMKVMAKTKGLWKGVLKEETSVAWTSVKATPVQLLLMGSAAQLSGPKIKTVFLEDMATEAVAKVADPAGLQNLGNTCYLNSVVQCLRVVAPLRQGLEAYQPSGRGGGAATNMSSALLVSALQKTWQQLDRQTDALPPLQLVQATKLAFPQFNQRGPHGAPMQQDAEEFYSGLLTILAEESRSLIQQGLPGAPVAALQGATNLVDALFGMALEESLVCTEVDDEAPVVTTDLARKLVCSIQGGSDARAVTNVSHVAEGIALSLEEGSIEKHSAVLGRNALWKRTQRLARLPPILTVQFGRFYWKATPDSQDHPNGVKCKVMKPVAFSSTMDVYEFCSVAVQKVLKVHRDAAIKAEEERLFAKDKAKEAADGDAEMKEATEEDPDLQAALALSMQTEEVVVEAQPPVGPGLPQDFQGLYELFAVVTHKGRDADGGHYMSWVKADTAPGEKIADTDETNDDWYVFDDDEVSPCKTEDVLKLKGGGDWHMSYLNFYRAKK
jgi:ubiquitin carboxyl-terminal hydrolase 14